MKSAGSANFFASVSSAVELDATEVARQPFRQRHDAIPKEDVQQLVAEFRRCAGVVQLARAIPQGMSPQFIFTS